MPYGNPAERKIRQSRNADGRTSENTGAAVQTDGFSNIAARVSEQYDMLAKELTEQGGKEEWM